MIIMIHDTHLNKFYLTATSTTILKGLEHGDTESRIFIKKLLAKMKPLDLRERLPHAHITKLYQIDTSLINLEVEEPAGLDPEPWEIPTTIRT